ncbi:alpha-(1-_3)-arabinofuranosyltransferase family protein [Micromonospora sp. WMMD964]|uniref:alpha-(1->3)-arabinofuranosyltransferase domain-containing protein n=1 Tax=Micromonospora sp. WMMD964 TaxID=3016091 RepID=UPI00249A6D51|nr:alpha-(1->3)-arabinofuranosyltransferase family protein [Micromonospora sp. WMMD964]WFF01990.1 alpha-(1->3)-arabinofuranosyltransferase family protein [Micromonospora sp. WMMD964]
MWRLRELLVCLALIGLCVTQSPGLIVPETKLDMALDPGGFLARATHLWIADWQFGSLQNQAVGYFFPMGPFFLLGEAIGLPAWLVQRLWMAALLCVALTGVVRLARALDLGGPASRLVAGAVFALSPRALTLVGTVSLELLPYCVAPWVLLPLVKGAAGGSLRRAAALSGLAVVCMGGANGAAAACAVLPAFLYVVTRAPGKRRLRLLACWTVAMVAATFWWLAPLLLLQRYGFPFLPFTESAAVTTGVTSLPEAVRGATHWVGHLVVDGLPWWPSGWALATVPWMALLTGLVACIGLAGLARRDLPERRFLLVAALVGLLTLTAGNLSSGGAPFAASVREALDGPLGALRNLHKFDVVIRLPLALATAHMLDTVGLIAVIRRFSRPTGMAPRRVALGVTAAALVAVAAGAGSAGLTAGGGFPALPEHWRQATGWLDRNAGPGTTLLVPGSNFAEYDWGRSLDEPVQPLLDSPWAVRSLVPAGSAGNARLLSAIDERLASGTVSPGLADVLARLGVRYLLVRNDLRQPVGAVAWPLLVHRTLDSAPGLSRVAEFGPGVGVPPDLGGAWDYGLRKTYPAVEIYRVDRPTPRVTLADAAQPLDLVGAPETLLDLSDAGVLGNRPVILNGDGRAVTGAGTVLADSLRRREVDFGLLRGNISRTFTADDRPRQVRAVHDILDPAWDASLTSAGYTGVADVRASSSAADVAGPAGLRDPSAGPFAALDGDSGTAWLTDGARKPVGQWLEVRFPEAIQVGFVDLQMVGDEVIGAPVTRVEVSTASGTSEHQVTDGGRSPQQVTIPSGRTTWLRVTIDGVSGVDVPGRRAGIRNLRVPGVTPGRYLRLPALPEAGSAPEVIALARKAGDRPACAVADDHYLCAPDLIRQGEETGLSPRRFDLPSASTAGLTGLARPVPATALAVYDEMVGGQTFTASSAWFADPVASSRALGDGDDGTGWLADPDDAQPTVELRWAKPRKVGWVRLRFAASLVAAPPRTLRITGDDGIREVAVDVDGVARFPALRTSKLFIAVTSTVPRSSRSTAFFEPQPLPVGLSGIDVEGVAEANQPRGLDRTVTLPCGAGPTVVVNGAAVPTTVSGTLREIRDLRPLRYRACAVEPTAKSTTKSKARPAVDADQVALRAGPNEISAPADRFVVDSVILSGTAVAPVVGEPSRQTVTVLSWTDQHRSVEVGAGGSSYLVVPENANPGWTATLDGVRLEPTRVDGWKQAWLVPAGAAGRIDLVFTPGRQYDIILRVAGGLLLLLVVAAVLPARRHRPSYPVVPSTLATAPLLAIGVPALLGGLLGFGCALLVVLLHRRRMPTPGWIWVPAAAGLAIYGSERWWLWRVGPEPVAELLAVLPTALLLVAVAALVLRSRRVRGKYESRRQGRLFGRARRGDLRRRSLAGDGGRSPSPTVVGPPREESTQLLRRPLHEVVAGGRDRDGQGQGHRQERPERAVHPGEAEQSEARLDGEDVPEEDAVGDPTEEPDQRLEQERARHAAGPPADERRHHTPRDEQEQQVLGDRLDRSGGFEAPGAGDRRAGDPEQRAGDQPRRPGSEREDAQPARRAGPQVLLAAVGPVRSQIREERRRTGAGRPGGENSQHDPDPEPVQEGGQPEPRHLR